MRFLVYWFSVVGPLDLPRYVIGPKVLDHWWCRSLYPALLLSTDSCPQINSAGLMPNRLKVN